MTKHTIESLRASGKAQKLLDLRTHILKFTEDYSKQNDISETESLATLVAIGKMIEGIVEKMNQGKWETNNDG